MISKYTGKLVLGLAAAYSLIGCASGKNGKSQERESPQTSYQDELTLEMKDVDGNKLDDLILVVKHKNKTEKALLLQFEKDGVKAFTNYASLALERNLESVKEAKALEGKVANELEGITGRKPLILNTRAFKPSAEYNPDNVIFYNGQARTVFTAVYLENGIAVRTLGAKNGDGLLIFVKNSNGIYQDLSELQQSKYDSLTKEVEKVKNAVKETLGDNKSVKSPVKEEPKKEDPRKKLLENPK